MRLDIIFISLLGKIGAVTCRVCQSTGKAVFFTGNCFVSCCSTPFYYRELGVQLIRVVFLSLPVIGMTALFTGVVLALQIYIGGSRFNAEGVVPSIVALGITRELGPVISALIIAGRVSSSIAAEIASMKVSEQIDALVTLSADPFKYLMAPRVLSMLVGMPFLVGVTDLIAIMGGYIVSVTRLGFNGAMYLSNTVNYLSFNDVFSGLCKAVVFGIIIALSGCYHGYNSDPGARGVGRATTVAVVSSCTFILISNYIMTEIFFSS